MSDFPFNTEVDFKIGLVDEKKRGGGQDGKREWVLLKLGLIAPNEAKSWAELFVGTDESKWPKVGGSERLIVSPAEKEGWAPKAERPGQQRARAGGGFTITKRDVIAIQRQHSQEMALRWTAIQQARGFLPDGFSIEDMRRAIDWFEADIKPGSRHPQWTGKTDVPAETAGLEEPAEPKSAEEVPF